VQGSDVAATKRKSLAFRAARRHCGTVNLFPGFSQMVAFTCRECGKANMA
jgi:hypothetical protein